MTTGPSILVLGAVAGLVLGSYAVTVGLRAAKGEGAVRGRSRCDDCRTPLSFARTVPVLSYVSQRGACVGCGARIDPIHLTGELAGAVVVAGALLITETPLRASLAATCGLLLISASATDWKVRRLPDPTTAGLAVVSFALAATRSLETLLTGLVAAVVAGVALVLLRGWSMREGRPAGLGLGDIKLASALAIWLGPQSAWMIAIAAGLGLVVMAWQRPADGRLAFGPMIALSGWALGMVGEAGLWPTTA